MMYAPAPPQASGAEMFSYAELCVLLFPFSSPLYSSLYMVMLVPQSEGSKIQNLPMVPKLLKTA